jgi:hypothetical protein
MKSKEFRSKKEAKQFIEKNGGHYQTAVDEYANIIYIVFYR